MCLTMKEAAFRRGIEVEKEQMRDKFAKVHSWIGTSRGLQEWLRSPPGCCSRLTPNQTYSLGLQLEALGLQ